jgi:o-succinylbenzoate synthase
MIRNLEPTRRLHYNGLPMSVLAVDSAELIAIGGALRGPLRAATLPWWERHGVALRLEADGLVGWGECSPLPGISPDRLDDATAALGRALAGELPRLDLEAPFATIRAFTERIPVATPSARFALDTALLDLCAQAYDGAIAALIGEGRAPVPASTIVSLEAWREDVPLALAQGLSTIRLAVARPGQLDAELAELRALREAYPDLALRFDAGGGFGGRDVTYALEALAELDPEWIEQPVPPGMLAALPPPPCPIAADESARADDDDLWQAVHRGIVSVLVIKPGLTGGLLRAADLCVRARSLGLETVIGHLHDGPIALAAAAELAVGLGGRYASGLGPHLGLRAFPEVDVPQLVDGALHSRGPGLGVALE